jgi:hypothetical protein
MFIQVRVRGHKCLHLCMYVCPLYNLGKYYAQCRPYNPKPDEQPERTLPTAAAFAACQDTDAWQCPRTWLPQPPPAPPASPPAPPPPAPPSPPPPTPSVLAAPVHPPFAPPAEPPAPAAPSPTVAPAAPPAIAASSPSGLHAVGGGGASSADSRASPNTAAALSVLAVACLCLAGVLLFYQLRRRRRRNVGLGGAVGAAAELSDGLEGARESPWPIRPTGSKVRSFTVLDDLD